MADTRIARKRTSTFPDDRNLVIAFQAGDRFAYTEIYRLYLPLVRRICIRLLGNFDDADEAAQESMLRVYQGLRAFNGRYRLQAWVARITTNVCLDELRARTRRPENGVHLEEETVENGKNGGNGGNGNGHEHDPLEILELSVERTRILDVLNSLPEEQRVALVMRAIEGRTHRELADLLGSSPARTKALVYRAKRRFRRSWAGLPIFVPFGALLRIPRQLRRLFDSDSAGGTAGGSAPATVTASQTAATATTASQAAVAASELAAGVSQAATAVSGAATAVSGAATAVSQAVAATPAVATVVQTTGDRLVAGITAVVLAAGVGAVSASQATEDPVPIEIVVAPEASPDPSFTQDPAPPRPQPQPPAAEETPAPTSEETGETPAPAPSPAPSPSPSPTSAPEPAPGYSLGFSWSGKTGDSCGCSPSSSLRYEEVQGNAGGHVRFLQEAAGVILDSTGHAPWRVRTSYEGQLGRGGGVFDGTFTIQASDGDRAYSIDAGDVTMTPTEDGYRTAIFATYTITDPATWRAGLPQSGTAQIILEWWSDGTSLYRADFALNESN